MEKEYLHQWCNFESRRYGTWWGGGVRWVWDIASKNKYVWVMTCEKKKMQWWNVKSRGYGTWWGRGGGVIWWGRDVGRSRVAWVSARYRCVLQCVAVCCSVLQHVAVCCSVTERSHQMRVRHWKVSSRLSLRVMLVCCSVLQCVAVCCSVLQCVAV